MMDRIRVILLVGLFTSGACAIQVEEPQEAELASGLVALAPEEAREDFAAGIVALHDFWYGEAIERFRRVQSAAPTFTLGYWGEAMALHENPFGHVEPPTEAMRSILGRIADSPDARAELVASDHEGAYLSALEVLISTNDGPAERHPAYVREMAALAEQFPDDIEARAFYARSVLLEAPSFSHSREVQDRTAEASRRVLEMDPNHHGGLHYLIHGMDHPEIAEGALDAAERYRVIAAGASHAVHMPSHIFMQMGRWDEVVEANLSARAASEAWIERSGGSVADMDWHALDFLTYGLLQQGREAEAALLLDEVNEWTGTIEDDGSLRWYNGIWHARHAMEVGPRSSAARPRSGYRSIGEELGLGIHAVQSGNLREAEELLEGIATRAEEREDTTWKIAAAELSLMLAIANGNADPPVEALRGAIELQVELPRPNETPDLVKPPEEVLGEALLELGRAAEALEAFEAGDARWPGRMATQVGMARAFVALDEFDRAEALYDQLIDQLRHAEDSHPILLEAQAFVSAR